MLEEAWQLLIERGLADLTLAELGRRVETSAGHLLYYFGSKDLLLLEVLRWSEAQLWQRWTELRDRATSFDEVFRSFCRQFLPDSAGDPRWLVWVEVWPRALRVEELRGPYDELDQVWRDALAELLEQQGVADAPGLARRVCALLDGFAVGLLLGEEGLDIEQVCDHAAALLPAELRAGAS